MPHPSPSSMRAPERSTTSRALPVTVPRAARADQSTVGLVEATGNPLVDRETDPARTVRLILVTPGGLELPLVASHDLVEKLLRSVGHCGCGDPCTGRNASRSTSGRLVAPRRVPTCQLLGRLRLVSRFETEPRGDAV
jgi:hypothetical protein